MKPEDVPSEDRMKPRCKLLDAFSYFALLAEEEHFSVPREIIYEDQKIEFSSERVLRRHTRIPVYVTRSGCSTIFWFVARRYTVLLGEVTRMTRV